MEDSATNAVDWRKKFIHGIGFLFSRLRKLRHKVPGVNI